MISKKKRTPSPSRTRRNQNKETKLLPDMQKRTDTQTTYERRITTLSGDRFLSIPIKYCKEHGVINKRTISIFNKICPKWRTFDTKVMIAIGFLRWLFNCQREETQLFLEGRGIFISTGEISKLSEEFLLRFYVIHKNHSSQMKNLFKKNAGYILHLDGSAEAGDENNLHSQRRNFWNHNR